MESNINNDQELYSYFVQRNATLCEENSSYLLKHREVKLMLNDYLSSLLLHKPDDVFKYTKDYFRVLCENPETNKVMVLVGPEGTGKSVLVQKLMGEFVGKFAFPNIYTTYENKQSEKRSYVYVPKEKFIEMINDGELVDYVFENDEYEGIVKKDIESIASQNQIAIIEIDIAGANRIYTTGIEATYISVVPPSADALRERIKQTKKLNTATVNKILENSLKEMKEIDNSSFFTYRIINDDLETGYEDFKNCILSSFPFLDENYEEFQKISVEKLKNAHLNLENLEA